MQGYATGPYLLERRLLVAAACDHESFYGHSPECQALQLVDDDYAADVQDADCPRHPWMARRHCVLDRGRV